MFGKKIWSITVVSVTTPSTTATPKASIEVEKLYAYKYNQCYFFKIVFPIRVMAYIDHDSYNTHYLDR